MPTKGNACNPLVLAYLRFALTLTKLKLLEEGDLKNLDKLDEFVRTKSLLSIFDGEAQAHLEWDPLFKTRRQWTFSKFLPTVPECNMFFGNPNPHNLLKQLSRLLHSGSSERKGMYSDSTITSWGQYAGALVELNGGWEAFLKRRSLHEVSDWWPIENKNVTVRRASDANSFVARMLHLYRDRYVQILTSTVGVLWPLWLLRDPTWISLLRQVQHSESGNFRIGHPLPEDDLFIDINTRVGDFDGLPYPFGHADYLLRNTLRSLKRGDYTEWAGTPWPTEAVNIIKPALAGQAWCPPVLFAAREPQFERNETGNDRVIALITISKPCNLFAAPYFRTTNDQIAKIKVAYEPETWAEDAVSHLREAADLTPLRRGEMLQDFVTLAPDLVLSYFPVDLLIQNNPEYARLTVEEAINRFPAALKALLKPFPATLLGSGARLLGQPYMKQLVIDLVLYLQKTHGLVSHLQASPEVLDPHFEALRRASISEKPEWADKIAQSCMPVTMNSKVFRDKLVEKDAVKRWMIDALLNMVTVISLENVDSLEKHISGWGWALLQEYVEYTWLFVSHEVATQKEKPK